MVRKGFAAGIAAKIAAKGKGKKHAEPDEDEKGGPSDEDEDDTGSLVECCSEMIECMKKGDAKGLARCMKDCVSLCGD